MELEIHKEIKVRIPRARLNDLFEVVMAGEADPEWDSSINLILGDNQLIRQLNRDYREKDKATDVLSFNIDDPSETGGVMGEVYVAVPFAGEQAKAYGGSLSDELVRLFCHGLLHLFGYDHERPEDAKVMSARQEKYLERFGVRAS